MLTICPVPFTEHPEATKVEAPTISPRVPEQIRNAKQVEDWVLYHPVYGPEEVKSIQVTRHPDKTLSDKAATALIRLFRFGFDLVSGYRHSTPEDAKRLAASLGKETLTLEDMRKANLVMDTKQWLIVGLHLYLAAVDRLMWRRRADGARAPSAHSIPGIDSRGSRYAWSVPGTSVRPLELRHLWLRPDCVSFTGMVAATLRHLRSLRGMKRDGG